MDKKPKRMVPEVRFKGFTDDWEQRKLGELVTSYDTKRMPIRSEERMAGPYPYYGATGIIDYVNNYIFDGKYLLLAEDGANIIDRTAPITYLTNGKFWLNNHAHIMNSTKSNLVFLKATLDRKNYIKFNTGTAQPKLNAKIVANLKLNLPVLAEQDKISKVISRIEIMIALQQRKLEQLRLLKRAMLQQLFVNNTESLTPNIRFNNFSKDWEQRKGKFIFKSKSVKGYPNLPVLSATQDKGMILRDKSGIDIKFNKKALSNYKKIEPGDFIVHLRSFQGGFAYSDIEGIASPAYTVFSFIDSKEFNDYFWKEKFCSYNFIQLLKKVTYGVRDGRSINYSDFLTLPEKYPLLEEQNKIGNILNKIDNLLSIQQIRAKKLNFLKKFLLQKLFI